MFPSAPEKRVALKILIDAILFLIVIALVPLFYVDIFTPFRRGYFCDDDSIRLPFKESTVTDCTLYVVGSLVGFMIIVLSELTQKDDENAETEVQFLQKWSIPTYFKHIYSSTYIFMFGGCITDVTTNYMKLFVGRLRPNFLDVCKSDFNCDSAKDPHFYVENYTCTNTDHYSVTDSRLSFPSGHSSFTMYAMLFSVIYLHKRLKCSYSILLKPMLQFGLLLLTAFIVISRIEDHKHHWSDVVGGLLLGALICFATVCILFHLSHLSLSKGPLKTENINDFYVMKGLDIS